MPADGGQAAQTPPLAPRPSVAAPGTTAAPAPRWSLLTPGKVAGRLERFDAVLFVAIYLMAFLLRWSLRHANPYTAEATHFIVSRGLWDSATSIRYLDGIGGYEDYSWFFWQRPMLVLTLWPFASLSFEAYRGAHIVLASTVPLLAAWLLRTLGVSRVAAALAGVVLAVHPILLPWGVLALPDSMMIAFVLAAMIAAHHGRPAGMAGLLLWASWIKEVAFVASLSMLLLALWRDADGRPASLRPLRVGRFALWLAPLVPLAFLPLWVSMQVPGVLFPGFRPGGDEALMYEALWACIYLAPIPLLGLWFAQTRRLSLLSLAWPAFFLLYHYGRDKAIEGWYIVAPATMTILAAAAALDWLARQRHGAARPTAIAVAGLLLIPLGVQAFVPDWHPLNASIVTPFSGRGQWDLDQVRHYESTRDDDMQALMAIPGPDERELWVAQDFDWSLVMYPVAAQANETVKVYSMDQGLTREIMEGWAYGIETLWNVTLVFNADWNLGNAATRAAYAECSVVVGRYTLIRASQCQGAGADIWERTQELQAARGR